ncbi:IclR family transcriptional regulator [Oceanisphaera pacifica]|uniref:HTH-type transcriptional repressor AllR n=1 Tax=Oceanisphaera pacifica TaxID=2818389 RepID=A0ABS3NH82_9GAMM|nr:IclR family transcriptional regulator [Oceanisphaera pacifica]MBO1519944.1 IclR family transcriptional regulator [Oceanisphaera pacifica]
MSEEVISKKNKVTKPAGTTQVQSLSRALLVLEQLATSDMGMSLTEVAGSLGLAPSTTHRLLNSLRSHHFVDVDDTQGLWSIGVNAFAVGNAYLKKRDVIAQSRPFMKRLVAETGETSNLAILEQGRVVYVGQVESPQTMRMVVSLGSSSPLHASGVGKALLSVVPIKDAMALIKQTDMVAFTEHTITDAEQFASELQHIKQQGYSLDDEEQFEGLRCIAANIYNEYGEAVAAISISGPAVRVKRERLAHLSRLVMDAAQEATDAIGGKQSAS